MAGTQKGSLMKKLGLSGATKPGDMIARMNQIKSGAMKAGSASGVGRIQKAKIALKDIKAKPKGKGIVKPLKKLITPKKNVKGKASPFKGKTIAKKYGKKK